MAKFEEIISNNPKVFEGAENIKENYSALSAKLNELGYDVLLNHKEKAEFVPSNRLSEVVSQRDGFKNQATELSKQLEIMKAGAKGNDVLQAEIQKLLDQNNNLLKDIENTKIQTELMIAAKDAINSKDLLVFVDMGNIKVNASGQVLGVDAEIVRLKAEKPYLFNAIKETKKRGGMDSNNKDMKSEEVAVSMNNMIRRAAGKIT